MTAIWLEPSPGLRPAGPPDLRLLGSAPFPRPDHRPDEPDEDVAGGLRLVDPTRRRVRPAPRRRVSVAVRRRRTILAVMALLLIGLALPMGGAGGHSHATGSALSESASPFVYTVQPGDTLWTIAERVQPSGDPRPLVAKLAAQTGSETVVPGEQITLP
jgi:hypothetical protein